MRGYHQVVHRADAVAGLSSVPVMDLRARWEALAPAIPPSPQKADLAELFASPRPALSAVAEGRQPTGLVARAHAVGLQVHPYTLRLEALPKGFANGKDYARFLREEVKVDGFFTDFPDVAR